MRAETKLSDPLWQDSSGKRTENANTEMSTKSNASRKHLRIKCINQINEILMARETKGLSLGLAFWSDVLDYLFL